MSAPTEKPQAGKREECAMVYHDPDGVSVVGGQKIGYPSKHRIQFVWGTPAMTRPYAKLRISFPRATDTAFNMHIIEVVLLAGTWTSKARMLSDSEIAELPPRETDRTQPMGIMTLTLNEGEKACSRSYGYPFAGLAVDEAIVNENGRLDGVKTLREIFAPREFVILFQGGRMVPRANGQFSRSFPNPIPPVFPYSAGRWSMKCYEDEVPRYAGTKPYTAVFKFYNHYDYFTNISQGLVQDVFHLAKDVDSIRSKPIRCLFLKRGSSPDHSASEFLVLVWHDLQKDRRFENSLPRLLCGEFRLSLAFGPPPCRSDFIPTHDDETPPDNMFWEARQVPSNKWEHTKCQLAIIIRRPQPWDPDDAAIDVPILAYPEPRPEYILGHGAKGFYLKFDAGFQATRCRVEAAYDSIVAYTPPQGAEGGGRLSDDKDLHTLKRELHTGSGFCSLVESPTRKETALPPELPSLLPGGSMQQANISPHIRLRLLAQPELFQVDSVESKAASLCPPLTVLPQIPILQGVPSHVRTAIGEKIGPKKNRFARYLKATRLGTICLIKHTGWEKTDLLAWSALLFVYNPKIARIYCSSTSHESTDSFAAQLYRLGLELATMLKFKALLVVRGYAVPQEVEAFLKIAGGQYRGASEDIEDPFRATRWCLRLSACEWLLKVVGARHFSLAPSDPVHLHNLRQEFLTKAKYEGLRRFVAGGLPFRGGSASALDSAIRVPAFELVKELITAVIMGADAVCTTPLGSAEPVYSRYKEKVAKGIVLDDAGAMLQADALLVWGYGCRPCAMGGGPNQITPAMATCGEVRGQKVVNMFSDLAKVSELEQLKRTGWPCFLIDG
ncbi:uncharacterized protein DNG_00054 [Cephalotrichum gorgonifer]|uniref:Uncharacterized protein n=1 Tax=Cephalotrichum gorgonifer TaxID=2041049 RepID=A0AAE8MN29_9PEZI|nr:uncharacterized protein DNG_00054 [Cephalotrichum gorgonifer]